MFLGRSEWPFQKVRKLTDQRGWSFLQQLVCRQIETQQACRPIFSVQTHLWCCLRALRKWVPNKLLFQFQASPPIFQKAKLVQLDFRREKQVYPPEPKALLLQLKAKADQRALRFLI